MQPTPGSRVASARPSRPARTPHAECASSGTLCGADGVCDGTGNCRANTPTGTTCGASLCVDNDTRFARQECNGSGTCSTSNNSVSCGDFKCAAGACLTVCTTTADCAPGRYCQTGACVAKQSNGIECATLDQCLSGACVDGICCESACAGTCTSCLGAFTGLASGKCGPVKAGELDPRGLCQAQQDPKDLCGVDGTCDATGKCALASKGNACGGASCSNNSSVAKACDGYGVCQESVTACSPYACDTSLSTCKKTCKLDTDCATEAKCEVNTSQCVIVGAECKDDFTVKAPSGTLTDCRPYKCAAGKCRDSCSTTNDCATGYECSGQTCVKAAAGDAGTDAEAPPSSLTAESDSGCGCRTAGTTRPHGGLALLGLAIASLLLRRR